MIRIVAIFAAALVAFPVTASTKDKLIGKWSGPVTQIGSTSSYWIRLTLSAKGGESYYPELSCGGILTYAGSRDGYEFYTETITINRERCIDGTITVARISGGLGWGWFGVHNNRTYTAYAKLAETK